MCFSAAASFGASVVISTIGIVSYEKAGRNPIRSIAWFPILFGIHQFIEGWVWVSSTHQQFAWLLPWATHGFIFVAWIIWPVFIPWILWKVEQNSLRKKILFISTLIGLLIVSTMSFFLFTKNITARIIDCSVYYNYGGHTSSSYWFRFLYALSVTLPNIFSSRSKMWLLGVMNLILYFFSRIYFEEHVVSVWCFFASISSILILYIVLIEKRKELLSFNEQIE